MICAGDGLAMVREEEGRMVSGRQGYHHGDLRAALKRAALELIVEHGVKGFTLKDAAEIAGVSTAAPYRHFADKEALIGELQGEGFAEFNRALKEAYDAGETAAGRVEELGVAYVRFAIGHPGHFRVMFGQGGKARPVPGEIGASGYELLVGGVAGMLPEASEDKRQTMVVACWCVVHGFAMLVMEGAFPGIGEREGMDLLRGTLRQVLAGQGQVG